MATCTPATSSSSEGDSSRMYIVHFSNEFPGENLQKLWRRVSNLAKDRRYPMLALLLNETTWAMKEEIRRLPKWMRQLIPPFDNVMSWAENEELRGGIMGSSVDGVLLVVIQLAMYIGFIERKSNNSLDLSNTCLTGLGIGLLAMTAASLTPQMANLPLAGADAARLAFRLGVHVQGKSEQLELRKLWAKPSSWAYVVHNIDPATAQQELDAINSSEEVPDIGRIFISAVSRRSITVSGPPTRLEALFNKSKFFRDTKFVSLPVYGGLCHASHVYGQHDVQTIVHGSPLSTDAQELVPLMPAYSTSTGRPYQAKSITQIFEMVVEELLTQGIFWDRTISGLVDRTKSTLASEAVLCCLGNSMPFNDLQSAIASEIPDVQVSTRDIVSEMIVDQSGTTTSSGPAQAKIAIVGMSCRLPGNATDTELFWSVLEKGLDVSRRIPADRFDIDTHYDPTGKELNKTMTQFGCFIDEPGLFDAPFFNMSPREAEAVDPQMRLALVTAYEALERSGYVANRTAATQSQRIGTFYGQAADDYREVNQGQEVGTYYIPGGCRAFGPGRINYFFKFAGPSYSIDTACSSGLAAIEVACQSLWNGEVDTAVAGGVNVLTNPDGFTGLCKGHFLTKGHNACKTFDATADGYCRADGIGSLVLKRLEDAEADNDNILGVLLGAGTNHSAEAVSITHPHAGHQTYLARQVLRKAGVDPLELSYVELHGTGTQAGDREEMEGILNVYAPLKGRRNKAQPLHIGSVKANVGHGESVAGTTALIKVLLMFQKNAIPPHVGMKTSEINLTFPKDFATRNLHIPTAMTSWPRVPGKKRIAAVNNFGAAGGNTTVILEEAPVLNIEAPDPRQCHAITVSAKTRASLTGNLNRLLKYVDTTPDVNLADFSYTTTARRSHYSFRTAFTASDAQSLRKQLHSCLSKIDSVKSVEKSGPPSIAFTFTGQGGSHKSMNLVLYHDQTVFQDQVQQLDVLAQNQGFPSFIPVLDGSYPKDHIHDPVSTQLSLVCMEIALAKHWMSLGVKPDIVVGHSLGEYAAMHIAGVITAADAIFMVGRRAQMLQEKCQIKSHIMMAVRASVAQIAESSEGKPYTVACVNSPIDTTLSGTQEEIDTVAVLLQAAGFRCIKLDVSFAFHSSQMDPILDDFERLVKTGVVFREPDLPVISPLLGKVVFDSKTLNAQYVRRATREAVNYSLALETARKVSSFSEETVWIEIGPHPVCAAFIKSISPTTQLALPSFRRDEDNWKTMTESMATLHCAGALVNWDEFHRPFEKCLRLLDLPTYAWSDKKYWLQYNGDWCLTKGNSFYDSKAGPDASMKLTGTSPTGALKTSTIHQVLHEKIDHLAGKLVIRSDLMQADFLAAANGHRMNDCGVVTSSIHADIAYSVGKHLYRKFFPKAKNIDIEVADLVVTKGLVAQSRQTTPQVIQVTATTPDISLGTVALTWQNVDNDGHEHEPFATATLRYRDASKWLASWSSLAHLVQGRIHELERLAEAGEANRFSHNMAYRLFAQNLVDYAEKYRGMQSVVMHGLEGFADVQLTVKESGTWTIPPYFIDSVAHLAGFIMNCSDTIDVRTSFCVTPGWESMRFAEPLVAGQKYRSYVKMIPTTEDPTTYLGDVYILQRGMVIGLVGGIQFRQYPRVLLGRFFSPPDRTSTEASKAVPTRAMTDVAAAAVTSGPTIPKPSHIVAQNAVGDDKAISENKIPTTAVHDTSYTLLASATAGDVKVVTTSAEPAGKSDSIADKAIELIANEAGLEITDLVDDASFASLGVDSLMSLVIVEKLRSELDVKVSGSLFLDYDSVGDLRKWLNEYYG